MSPKYYAKLWVATCDKIHEIITQEKEIQTRGAVSKPQIAHSTFAELLVSYTAILNDLTDIFDQTLQVQKRRLIKMILTTVTNRVLELRKDLCEIEISEYFYIDHTLISSHLTPQDVCFNRPNYFPLKRSEEYNEIIAKYSKQRTELTAAVEKKKKAEFLESLRTKAEIEYTFLGMLENRNRPVELIEIIEHQKEYRRSLVEVFAADFEKTIADTKAHILKTKSQTIKEDISDFIRNWFRIMYKAAGNFDIYPPAAKGGSMAIIKGETMSPQEFAEYSATEKRPSNDKQEKISKTKATNSKKTGKTKTEWNFSEPSQSFVNLETAMREYEREWICVDEIGNSNEKPYMEYILADTFAEVHKELHLEVDECMREEYELLRQARCKDLGIRYKKSKSKGVGRKGKGKAKTKRSPADITAARSIDSLIAELVENDILIDVPKKSFDEFIGDYNYLAYENRNIDMTDPMPCLGEVKSTIRSWIIGMGPLDFEKTKSICLLGPPGCGKKHIIYAVAAELGAVVFNLSSEVVCKYRENMPYFVHFVTKMAKILQPVVLFIDGAHKPFIKKAPTLESKEEYKIIRKYLPKIVKSFKSSDRVLLMGATNEPWNSAGTKMKKCFEKFVLIPTEQYGDKFLIWQTGIKNRLAFIPNINISTLARVNIEYSAAAILNAIDQVLTTSRMNMLRTCPLNEQEFMYAMSKQEEPLGKKFTEKYRKWYVAADKLAKARHKIGKDARKPKK